MFDGNVRELLGGNDGLARIILPLLEAWRDIRKRAADLDHQLLAAARASQATKLLMTIPGIGAVTAVSYVAAIEAPKLQNVALGRRLARADNAALSVRRG